MSIWIAAHRGRRDVAAPRKKQIPLAPPFGLVIAVGLTATLSDLPIPRMPANPTGPLILPALDKPTPDRLQGVWSHEKSGRASIGDGRQANSGLALSQDRPSSAARRRTKRGRMQSMPRLLAVTPRFQDWTFAPDDIAQLDVSLVPPKVLAEPRENRRAASLGIAAETMRFDDRPGCLSTAAETARWNGQPAAVMGIGYTLPDGRARLSATGVTSVMPGQKTFGVSAVASIALE